MRDLNAEYDTCVQLNNLITIHDHFAGSIYEIFLYTKSHSAIESRHEIVSRSSTRIRVCCLGINNIRQIAVRILIW